MDATHRSPRLIPLLTRKGFVSLSSILIGPFLGLLLPVSWQECIAFSALLMLGFILLGLRDYFRATSVLKGFSISGGVAPRLYSGVRAILQLKLHAPAPAHSLHVLLRPEIPEGITAENEVFLVPASDDEVTIEYPFTPLARGTLLWPGVTLRLITRSGLFSFQTVHPYSEQVLSLVFPNPYCNPDRKSRSVQKLSSGNTIFSMAGGEGREFDSLRQYSTGDDPRRIDWKRSARRGSVLVKLYRPETHQRINILIDCSRRMANSIENRLQLDYAADSAAYLARLASENDDEVGLFAFHHHVVSQVACRRGRQQQSLIMEQLLKLEAGELEGDYELVKRFGRSSRRRSLLVLLTSITTPANLDNLRLNLLPISQKHLPLVVAIYDRELQRLLDSPVETTRDAFIAAAAYEQRESIAQRVELLRRSGIECIYSDALDIPRVLEQKYYELKLSGRL